MFRMLEIIVMTREAIRAVPKESIWKPSIRFEAIRMRIALITKRNSPRVRMVAGSVSKISIGLTNTFKIANTTAIIMAVV